MAKATPQATPATPPPTSSAPGKRITIPQTKQKVTYTSKERARIPFSSSRKSTKNKTTAYLSPEFVEDSEPEEEDESETDKLIDTNEQQPQSTSPLNATVAVNDKDNGVGKQRGKRKRRSSQLEETGATSPPTKRPKRTGAVLSPKNTGPVQVNQHTDHDDSLIPGRPSDRGETIKRQIATSTARRSGLSSKIPKTLRTQQRENLEPVDYPPESSSESDTSNIQESSPPHSLTENASNLTCAICSKVFLSTETYHNHVQNPSVHAQGFNCPICDEGFSSNPALLQHQVNADHAPRGARKKIGQFTTFEVQKIDKWRSTFCDYHDINKFHFNEMMIDTLRLRVEEWPYKFIRRDEFLDEYYDILPQRDRRSMRRYRERAFLNIEKNKPWTSQDDQELIALHKSLGSKWVEISQRLSRNSDDVRLRWKNKLKFEGQNDTGPWSQEEAQKLRDLVTMQKRDRALALDNSTDNLVAWSSVSLALGGTRTAQQCSNHWRAMNVIKVKGRYRKHPPTATDSAQSRRTSRLDGGDGSSVPPPGSHRLGTSAGLPQGDLDESALIEQGGPTATPSKPALSKSSPPASRRKVKSKVRDGNPKTPRGQSMSQLFAQTQADSSAVRDELDIPRFFSQPARPSPALPVQHRPDSPMGDDMNEISPAQLQTSTLNAIDENEDVPPSSGTGHDEDQDPEHDAEKAPDHLDDGADKDAEAAEAIKLDVGAGELATDHDGEEDSIMKSNLSTEPTSSSGLSEDEDEVKDENERENEDEKKDEDDDEIEVDTTTGQQFFSSADVYTLPEASSDTSSDTESSDSDHEVDNPDYEDTQSNQDDDLTSEEGTASIKNEDSETDVEEFSDSDDEEDLDETDKDSLVDAAEGDYKQNDFMASIQSSAAEALGSAFASKDSLVNAKGRKSWSLLNIFGSPSKSGNKRVRFGDDVDEDDDVDGESDGGP